jgi:hypothetical protein
MLHHLNDLQDPIAPSSDPCRPGYTGGVYLNIRKCSSMPFRTLILTQTFIRPYVPCWTGVWTPRQPHLSTRHHATLEEAVRWPSFCAVPIKARLYRPGARNMKRLEACAGLDIILEDAHSTTS